MLNPTVFEYGHLTADLDGEAHGFTLISKETFGYLESQCLGDDERQVAQYLQPRTKYGLKTLQVKNYVGVIFAPFGEQVEVLPKVGKAEIADQDSIDYARSILMMMLDRLGDFRYISNPNAGVETQKRPLMEIFIGQFLESVNHLVKRGLRSDYSAQQDNLSYQKGKMLIAKQLRHNAINKHRFFVEFDEYQLDRPENRLIKSALNVVANLTKLAQNQKLLRELQFAFDEVSPSQQPSKDMSSLSLDRGMRHYYLPVEWAKLILNGLSPLSMKGQVNAASLLFPMEAVFEHYVAKIIEEALPAGEALTTQTSAHSLVKLNNKGQFRLKPDLMITKENGHRVVLDTKWKLLDLNSHHFGLSQADFYQMFAYGHKYLNGKGDMYLIYPAQGNFTQPIAHSFDYSDELRLWVVPFEMNLDSPCRVIWPDRK